MDCRDELAGHQGSTPGDRGPARRPHCGKLGDSVAVCWVADQRRRSTRVIGRSTTIAGKVCSWTSSEPAAPSIS